MASGPFSPKRTAVSVLARLPRPFRLTLRRAGLLGTVDGAVLISGPQRTGKSTIARQVAERTGSAVIPTDWLRESFNHIEERRARAAELHRLVTRALATRTGGLVIEGVHLTMMGDKRLVDLGMVSDFAERFGAAVFLVGCTAGVEQKAAAIRGSEMPKSYTVEWTSEQLARVAEGIQRRSILLREAAESSGFEYLEIGTQTFRNDVDSALAQIV